jgi:hypothetical protein
MLDDVPDHDPAEDPQEEQEVGEELTGATDRSVGVELHAAIRSRTGARVER